MITTDDLMLLWAIRGISLLAAPSFTDAASVEAILFDDGATAFACWTRLRAAPCRRSETTRQAHTGAGPGDSPYRDSVGQTGRVLHHPHRPACGPDADREGVTLAEEPCRANSFNLLIEGTTVGGFVSASDLGAQVDGIADRKAAAGTSVRNLPGLRKQDPLELRYGIARRNISLLQYSDDGSSVAHRWNLFNARPTKVPVGTLDVLLNEIAIETSDTGL